MILKRFITICFASAFAISALCAPPNSSSWEPVKHEMRDVKSVAKEDEIEILTMPGHIIINCSRKVNIQVFTILGRLVSSETLPPGTSRLSVPTHGVYIVKAGTLTCKVAV